MASLKQLFLLILVWFTKLSTTIATDNIGFSGSCSGNKTTPNSSFQLNLKTLFSYLSSNATANKGFYNTTIHGNDTNTDTVYGMFMCRADIPAQLCSECVSNATNSILSTDPELGVRCYLSKDAVLQNDVCMIRYSNRSFFSIPDLTSPPSSSCYSVNVSNQASFERLVLKTMNQVADVAATIFSIKYATKEARISGFQTLYSLAQCTPDLSPQDCRKCLNVTISGLKSCNYENKAMVGDSETDTCYIKYDTYPFYRTTAPSASQQLIPSSNTDHSKYSQTHPTYLSHNCSTSTNETDIFQSNLKSVFSSIYYSASTRNSFLKITVETVNGLFMCRGDVSSTLCQLCIQNATNRITLLCPSAKEAIIWYDQCFLRYSDRSLVPSVEASSNSPKFQQFNMAEVNSSTLLGSSFASILADTLSKVVKQKWESSDKKYGTRSVKLNGNQTLYTLAQCTPDLSETDCGGCLDNIFRYEIPWCCLESPEGKVLYPSCYIMFGLSQFYRDGGQPPEVFIPPSPPPTTTVWSTFEDKTKSSKTHQNVSVIVVPIVASIVLLSLCCYLLRKKVKKSNYKTLLRKNFGDESTAIEGLQFDLALIKAATNNFSQENKIGKGGFGEVYKGILLDGRQIAVKRLLKSSKQGLVEFKTEILLIAKLQQRNLVALIGFCLEEEEKILIYEFVTNGSLDSFLFGTQEQMLSWSQRYKIIGGSALGILYLHEYSRLKVIHRDLKPSNILLDENMNPKISDFGMARIVEIDEERGNTNRIAGTFGYMSPEYAMFGHFSEKSDVFSFGVMVLEIITGKKNINSYEPHPNPENLISYVWREWEKQKPLSILDTNMGENYSQDEVIKCIHMGLLCVQENPNVRPTMATIVSYLNNHSLELPSPQEPAFFLNDRANQYITSQQESSFGTSTNSFISSSINEMTISEFYPRE